MFVYIESLEPKKVNIVLFDNKKIIRQKTFAAFSDKILDSLDKLAGGHAKLMKLGAVVVHQGPGTFSAVRSGVLLANTIAVLLDIKIVAVRDKFDSALLPKLITSLLAKKNNQLVSPLYNREPNITIAKK